MTREGVCHIVISRAGLLPVTIYDAVLKVSLFDLIYHCNCDHHNSQDQTSNAHLMSQIYLSALFAIPLLKPHFLGIKERRPNSNLVANARVKNLAFRTLIGSVITVISSVVYVPNPSLI